MSDLRAGAGISTQAEVARAVDEAVSTARAGLAGAAPGLALVTATVDYDAAGLWAELQRVLPDVPLQAVSTSLGALSTAGVAAGRHGSLGVLLLSSAEDARFAVGTAAVRTTPREAGRRAAQAIAARGLAGMPRVLFIAGSPGAEEELLAGVGEIFPDVPVFGGSAADHTIEGLWWVFTDEGPVRDGVSVAAVYGDVRVGAAIEAPYRPTEASAAITAADDRAIRALDGRPAGEVLQGWIGAPIEDQVREGGNILVQTALTPLGIARRGTAGDFYTLLHPAQAHRDGVVDVFARAEPGETVCLMRGSEASLVSVVEQLADSALSEGGLRPEEARAGVLIYCAGCAGAVGAGLERALQGLQGTFGALPLSGRCTFGEQGHVPGVGNVHTNLSVALVLLG
jgi:hypothetical protein